MTAVLILAGCLVVFLAVGFPRFRPAALTLLAFAGVVALAVAGLAACMGPMQ